jgi:uncharacterized protein (TIGR02271 family)
MSMQMDANQIAGRTAIGADGEKIGKVVQIYINDQSGAPEWVAISTGLFGHRESLAPLAGSVPEGDDLRLAVSKDMVKEAPQIEQDGHLDDSETEFLYRYYADHLTGMALPNRNSGQDDAVGVGSLPDAVDRPSNDDLDRPTPDDAMTRSEERLEVGTQAREAGRARLRKYVVTENVTTTVPVSHEEVRIEREPITESNRDDALSGEPIQEAEHEVVLHAEEPVVQKHVEPVERVRLSKDTVQEQRTIEESVRKEQVDLDEDRP